jgi:hypothetical protein
VISELAVVSRVHGVAKQRHEIPGELSRKLLKNDPHDDCERSDSAEKEGKCVLCHDHQP